MNKFLLILSVLMLLSCSQSQVKEIPSYGTEIADPEVRMLVNEYKYLSAYNHITFKHNVTIGFTKINQGRVIGLCTYGRTFREIDLDSIYWKNASATTKQMLVFHELTHCYCNRDHDYGDGTKYPASNLSAFLGIVFEKTGWSVLKPEGYMDDHCPLSIMHPIIMSDYCAISHYEYYVKEMFARCEPY